MGKLTTKTTISLNIAVLTVSDTRDLSTDTSGEALIKGLQGDSHQLTSRDIVKDDIYAIRAHVSNWIAHDKVQVVLITGGTGFTQRDNTPEAVTPLFDKTVEGFGELFRTISEKDIGTSTIQSRAIAGMANKTLIFCVPGSTNACLTAWEGIISKQIDSCTSPCNFVPLLKNISLDMFKQD